MPATQADPAHCFSVEATVRSIAPDGYDVELDRAAACAGCAGACMWSAASRARTARVRSSHALRVGDRVRVVLPAEQLLSSTLLLHGAPLAALLAGGALGAILTASDVGCLAGAVLAVGVVVAVAPRLRRRVERLTAERVVLEPVRRVAP
jgi:positive regulator of sigma E activity